MSEPSRSEQIVYLTEWAARNHGTLQLNGTVGFGRDCVGILGSSDHYIDTAEVKNTYAYQPGGEWWEPEDSYHKHDCLAVLGHGDGPLRQLYDWVKWLDEHGFGAEDNYRQPKDSIDLAFHGLSLTKIVKLPAPVLRQGGAQ